MTLRAAIGAPQISPSRAFFVPAIRLVLRVRHTLAPLRAATSGDGAVATFERRGTLAEYQASLAGHRERVLRSRSEIGNSWPGRVRCSRIHGN